MKKGSLADRWIAHLAPKADDLHRDLYGSWLDRAVDDTERTPLHPSEVEYQIDEREASIVHLAASMIRVAKDRGMKLPDPSFATDLPLRKLIATISASSRPISTKTTSENVSWLPAGCRLPGPTGW